MCTFDVVVLLICAFGMGWWIGRFGPEIQKSIEDDEDFYIYEEVEDEYEDQNRVE